ncbi:MAG: hypothetical protein MI863_17760 [Desulfobacterales bacterium]|nr:hypothetical protein [Desulfobacterales bacterium]
MAHDTGKGEYRRLPKTMVKYRSGGTPWIVIIDPEGIIVYNQFHIDVGQAAEMIRELLEKG